MDHLTSANRDLDALTYTQLEHESIRLTTRLSAVRARMEHVLATSGGRKKRKLCAADGCTNAAQKEGVCRRHGAPSNKKRCSAEGCENQAQRGGVSETLSSIAWIFFPCMLQHDMR